MWVGWDFAIPVCGEGARDVGRMPIHFASFFSCSLPGCLHIPQHARACSGIGADYPQTLPLHRCLLRPSPPRLRASWRLLMSSDRTAVALALLGCLLTAAAASTTTYLALQAAAAARSAGTRNSSSVDVSNVDLC